MSRFRRVLAALILICVAACQAGCASKLVYHPVSTLSATLEYLSLEYEEVVIELSREESLHGWFIPARSSRGTLLFCHGNAGNISHRLESIETFHRLLLDVFIFDYRGFGQSSGKPSEKHTYEDARAAWDYLTRERGVPPEEIIIFGRSLGGSIAANLASQVRPAALIVESSFISIPEVAIEHFAFAPVRLITTLRYDTRKSLKKIKCPVLIVHSQDDEIIPYAYGR